MLNINLPKVDTGRKKRNISQYSKEQVKLVFQNYLFKGMSHRALDRCVLGLNPDKSKGFQSMAILHYYGITAPFKGILSGMSLIEAINELKKDPSYREIINILSYNEQIDLVPPLKKQNRKYEFRKYQKDKICEVVYQYLFLSKTHRQLDKDVLMLDPKKTKGFQSFAILNYLGLNGAFKGLFYGKSTKEALSILTKATVDCSQIIEILSFYNDEKVVKKEQDSPNSRCIYGKKDDEKSEDVIELVLLDYSMHSSRQKRK